MYKYNLSMYNMRLFVINWEKKKLDFNSKNLVEITNLANLFVRTNDFYYLISLKHWIFYRR